MKLENVLLSVLLAFCIQSVAAQSGPSLSCSTVEADSPAFLAPPISKIEVYYKELIAKNGRNSRYEAAEIALEKYNCSEEMEEYAAKLYNLLAEEALYLRSYNLAKENYEKVLNSKFIDGYYTNGLIAERAELDAMVGLRIIAMEEKDYKTALVFHHRYVDSLERNWSEIAKRNQLVNDKIFATCYQFLGKSEKAINYLSPYAFGMVGSYYSTIDKEIIDYLTTLLKTKYPKKAYKHFLNDVATNIYSEEKNGRVLFYLKVLENKIYFGNDSANFENLAAQDETMRGAGIAHYQRKLLNSYFYQSLFKQILP